MLKSILNSNGVQPLNREEQKSIVGGARYLCMCIGSVGAWEGNYNEDQLDEAIDTWCASNLGTCQELPSFE